MIANRHTLAVDEVIDLTLAHDGSELLGWCRGLYFPSEGGVWIGFSRIRATKLRENIGWIAHKLKRSAPTHIAHYDLERRTLTREISLEEHGLSAVFSVLSAS